MSKLTKKPIYSRLNMELGSRSYPIIIGFNLLSHAPLMQEFILSDQVMIVTTKTIATWYLPSLKQALSGYAVETVLIPDGEEHKTLTSVDIIVATMLEHQQRRNTTLIALGGGMIGDLTGFVASCYQRGVRFLQIPTTLLAQVDASIGGKTAVNHPLGKNTIGAFHQPSLTLIDIQTLTTLPMREYRAGLAEVIKVALIADQDFFDWLEQHLSVILQKDFDILAEMISRACQIKINIVQSDEFEHGERALLNFGHTFAHALEVCTSYQTLLHGEAVAIGCHFAALLSVERGLLAQSDRERITHLLLACGFDLSLPSDCSALEIVTAMSRDKKNQESNLRMILLQSLGKAVIVPGVFTTEVIHLIEKNR